MKQINQRAWTTFSCFPRAENENKPLKHTNQGLAVKWVNDYNRFNCTDKIVRFYYVGPNGVVKIENRSYFSESFIKSKVVLKR